MNKLEQDIEDIFHRFQKSEDKYRLVAAIICNMTDRPGFWDSNKNDETASILIKQIVKSNGFCDIFDFEERASKQEYEQLFDILRKYSRNSAFL